MSHHSLEAAFLQTVRNLARLCGWASYHTRDSRGSDAGFPDLVLVRDHRVLFVELKVPGGRLTPDQATWLERLGAIESVGARLWTPDDWETIEEELRRG